MDFCGTIIELMGNTEVTYDLTSYIPQMEEALTKGIQTVFGGRYDGRFCMTQDIKQIADEGPYDGRIFGGTMFLAGQKFSYQISFKNVGSPYLNLAYDQYHGNRGISCNPLRPNSFNEGLKFVLDLAKKAAKETAKKMYTKISDGDMTDILHKMDNLATALNKAGAKILVDLDGTNTMYVVPSEVEVSVAPVPGNSAELKCENFLGRNIPYEVLGEDQLAYCLIKTE